MFDTTRLTRRQGMQLLLQGSIGATLASTTSGLLKAADAPADRTVPAVPGTFEIKWRRRKKQGNAVQPIEEITHWKASETAIIICDMWADHPCKLAAMRVDRMAPRMNRIVSLARDHGVVVIHAPSSGIKYYEDTPYRARMKKAVYSKPPVPIQGWCYLNPKFESPLPVVDNVKRGTSNVTGCDDPDPKPQPDSDRHQHPAIKMIGYDGVSANGQEIFNFLEQEQRKNIVLMGVHTNMCVLGRPFGIRQQKYLGKNVVLCRDLTDGLYDPRDKPHVSHARGVELIIEHIEEHWCPSILGESLTRVLDDSSGP
ncbi:MAG: isochorismatase family protein [Pirellulaceae bacterium]